MTSTKCLFMFVPHRPSVMSYILIYLPRPNIRLPTRFLQPFPERKVRFSNASPSPSFHGNYTGLLMHIELVTICSRTIQGGQSVRDGLFFLHTHVPMWRVRGRIPMEERILKLVEIRVERLVHVFAERLELFIDLAEVDLSWRRDAAVPGKEPVPDTVPYQMFPRDVDLAPVPAAELTLAKVSEPESREAQRE